MKKEKTMQEIRRQGSGESVEKVKKNERLDSFVVVHNCVREVLWFTRKAYLFFFYFVSFVFLWLVVLFVHKKVITTVLTLL